MKVMILKPASTRSCKIQRCVSINTRVLLFGLKVTEAPSASNWMERSIDNYESMMLPKTFKELEQIPLDQPYNFNDCKAYYKNTVDISENSPTPLIADVTSASPSIAIVVSQKEKGQCVELWKLRRRILEDKTENLVSGTLARYT